MKDGPIRAPVYCLITEVLALQYKGANRSLVVDISRELTDLGLDPQDFLA